MTAFRQKATGLNHKTISPVFLGRADGVDKNAFSARRFSPPLLKPFKPEVVKRPRGGAY